MPGRIRLQIVVGLVAAVWFVLALFTGQALSPTPLRLYSISGTVVTLALLGYERFLWRLDVLRRLTGVPLIDGTWRGVLHSSYVHEDGTPASPIRVALRVTQTASTFTATLFTAESYSVSRQERLMRLSDQRWCLSWLYDNAPKPTVRHRSERHVGACELRLSGRAGEELAGEYFTDRLTRGELHLTEWSPDHYASGKAAFAAADFVVPAPFPRRSAEDSTRVEQQ